jgi:PAS domain S-box-containing protein
MIDYRDILDSMDRGIVTVDLQGEITSCNRALEEILEVEAKTIVGHSLEEAFASEDPLYRLLKESIQEEAGSQQEENRRKSRGNPAGDRHDRNTQVGRESPADLKACGFGPAHPASGP